MCLQGRMGAQPWLTDLGVFPRERSNSTAPESQPQGGFSPSWRGAGFCQPGSDPTLGLCPWSWDVKALAPGELPEDLPLGISNGSRALRALLHPWHPAEPGLLRTTSTHCFSHSLGLGFEPEHRLFGEL